VRALNDDVCRERISAHNAAGYGAIVIATAISVTLQRAIQLRIFCLHCSQTLLETLQQSLPRELRTTESADAVPFTCCCLISFSWSLICCTYTRTIMREHRRSALRGAVPNIVRQFAWSRPHFQPGAARITSCSCNQHQHHLLDNLLIQQRQPPVVVCCLRLKYGVLSLETDLKF
jgi:hypothetical protein